MRLSSTANRSRNNSLVYWLLAAISVRGPNTPVASNRQPFKRRLGLVDLCAVNRHQHPRRCKTPSKRHRDKERPIGGMDDIVAFGSDKAACEQDFGRKVPHRMQSAAKASDFKRQRAVQRRGILAVIRRDHRYIGTESGSRRSDLARIGADPAVGGRELAGKQENVHAGDLSMPMARQSCPAHSGFPDENGRRARVACPG